MALAGTARAGERARFEVDGKEIREHEMVVGAIESILSRFGEVDTGRRSVLDLGPLMHFQTAIHAELHEGVSANELVGRMHPTPALGPQPRTGRSLQMLRSWRERLGCPRWFGAPFGVWRNGTLDLLVGIRMVVTRGRELMLPSGCGVIQQSRLANEWRELKLKRDSVRDILGVAGLPAPA